MSMLILKSSQNTSTELFCKLGFVELGIDNCKTVGFILKILIKFNMLDHSAVTSQKVLVHHVIPAKAGIQ